MRKSLREKLADAKRTHQETQILTLDGLYELLLDDRGRPVDQRKANPTQILFRDDPAVFKGYMGPKGCSKTSTIAGCGMLRAILQPGSKGFVGRNDYNDVMSTTGRRMEEMLARLPKGMLLDRSKAPPMEWWIQPMPTLSSEGDILDDRPSLITFIGMESIEAGGSFEVNWGIIDEMDEVKSENVRITSGWLRHVGGDYSVMGAWNPTDTFHWLYSACTGRDHQERRVGEPWIKLFVPEPKENQRNLPEDYYKVQAAAMTEDQRVRYIEGKWGGVFPGLPVLMEFKFDTHTKKNLMQRYDKYTPLFRFWDFGYRHPYCCWAQFDWQGRLMILKEHFGTDLSIDAFIDSCAAKQAQWFPDHKAGNYYDYGDPAARQKKDTGSTMAALYAKGITLRWKITTIDEGLESIRKHLMRLVGPSDDQEPSIIFDQDGVPILIRALRGGYHRDEDGQKAVKDGFYDHPVDAFRYGVVNVLGVIQAPNLLKSMPQSLEYRREDDKFPSGG